MSIPRQHRLRKHSEFELVYRCGRRHFSSAFTAFYLLREQNVGLSAEQQLKGDPQIGITVGRALGKATLRNRIKRRVRAAVSQNLNLLTRPVDIVINPKKMVAEIDYQQLNSEMARAFDVIEKKAVPPSNPTERNSRGAGSVSGGKS